MHEEKVRAFFERPDRYLDKNLDVETRRRIVQKMILSLPNSRSILDLGCGDGSVTIHLASHSNQLTLVDFSEAMLERARAGLPPEHSSKIKCIQSNLFEFAPGRRFDVVVCMGVLAHVHSVRDALVRICELLEAGGHLILQFTDCDTLSGRLLYGYDQARRKMASPVLHETNRIRARDVLSYGRQCGLVLKHARYYLPLLPGLGRLPASWGRWLGRRVLANPRLSFVGSDAIYLMQFGTSANQAEVPSMGV